MNSDQVRDAATRYRRYQGGENPFQIWGGGYCSTSSWADMRALGEAYLAEHPADGTDGVTEEWLKSLPGCRVRGPHAYSWANADSGDCVWISMTLGYPTVTVTNHDGRAAHLYGFGQKCKRDQIRRLLAALGLPAA